MEKLIIVFFLAVIIWLAYWLQSQAEPVESKKKDDRAQVPDKKISLPPFEGKILAVPDVPNSYENIGVMMAMYIRVSMTYEKALGLTRNQSFKVANEAGMELQDVRYRIVLLNWLLVQGSVNTAQAYGEPASCGHPHFYPEIFAHSCKAVEKDLAQLTGGGPPDDVDGLNKK